MRKKLRLCALICGVAALLCACNEKIDNTKSFTDNEIEEPAYQGNLDAISPSAYSNVRGLPLEPGTYISVLGKDDSSSYWKAVKAGVDQAAADLNEALGYIGEDKIKVIYNAPAEAESIDEQVNILDEELARYPDALAIASIDAEACTVQFDLAMENNIPIVAFDSGNSYQGIQSTCKTDNEEAARTGAAQLSSAIGNSGEIILLVHDSKSATAKERTSAFLADIEANHGDVKVVETLYYDQIHAMKKTIAEEKNKALEEGEKKLTGEELSEEDVLQFYLEKHPNVKACFGTNVVVTQWGLKTCTAMKNLDNMVLMGFDAGDAQLKALKAGDIDGLIVQNPFGIGYATVVASARCVLQQGNEAVVDTGYVWVTQDNLEEEAITNMLYK